MDRFETVAAFLKSMRVLTLVPSDAVGRIRSAFPDKADRVAAISDFGHFVEYARSTEFDVIVLDPEILDLAEEDVANSVKRFAHSLVLYTRMNRTSARLIATLSRSGLTTILLRGHDDTPTTIGRALRAIPAIACGTRMIEELAMELDTLPVRVRRGTVAAYCSVNAMASSTELANACTLGRRSVDRWLARAGLRSARWVVATANLLRAHELARRSRRSLTEIASGCGFGSTRCLRHNALDLTGFDFRTLVSTVELDGLVELLVRRSASA